MIRYASTVTLSPRLRETVPEGEGAGSFPFAALETDLAWFEGRYAPWHWHEYVEFAWVLRGTVLLNTPGGSLRLEPGEGYFVNASVLHANTMPEGCAEAKFRILQLDPALLCASGRIAQCYVRPVERSPELEMLRLSPGDPDAGRLLGCLASAFAAAESEPPGWELAAVRELFGAWGALYALAAPRLGGEQAPRDGVADRAKAMLACIHERYAEPLTVEDIARAASISEREAYRSFRQALGTTPTLYLTRHRVHAAARLLRETDLPVTDIAVACGFATPNYFSKVFRDAMGRSPRDFRQR